jgi:glucose/arabinose dehydrogenase
LAAALAVALLPGTGSSQKALAPPPLLMDASLSLQTVVSGLNMPTNIAFLGPNDFLVLEKSTGRVQRVTNGAVQGTVLDLPVNFSSERGLLGIALHPSFASNGWVYLYWTARSTTPLDNDPFTPEEQTATDAPGIGPDTEDLLQVPLLANRVDRFVWNGSALSWDRHLITLRAFQNDAAPTPPNQGDAEQAVLGNHDGGMLAFGPDGKLYVFIGDVGRRGQLQNLPSGPTATGLGDVMPDDQFGGPQPDNAHLAGVILRLNDDGSTPTDNPFFNAGAATGGEAGANIQKIFAYGFRNSFGMAFDPISGHLWMQENGEDAFDEINRIEPGMNGGWIQIMGPAARVPEFRAIETTSTHHEDFPNLQQFRWLPANIATTTEEAMSRLFVLPGSQYSDPEFSWKYVVAPAAIAFASGQALGAETSGDLIVGVSTPEPMGGVLFRFNMDANRTGFTFSDPKLQDLVADNVEPHEATESESLILGRDFGIVTDIEVGPNGSLFVVSLDKGAVYEIAPAAAGGTEPGTQPVTQPPATAPQPGTPAPQPGTPSPPPATPPAGGGGPY